MAAMLADYVCEDCKIVWEYCKAEKHHIFPTHPPCPKCGNKNTRRKWGSFNYVVKKGRVGNSKDGYTGWKDGDLIDGKPIKVK